MRRLLYALLAVQCLLHLPSISVMGSQAADEKPCADFNYASSAGAMAGLENAFVCPFDGVAQVHCNERFPLKPITDIKATQVNLSDVLFYVLVGPKSKTDAFKWWLPLLRGAKNIDIALVADPCPEGKDTCNDGAASLMTDLQTASIMQPVKGSGNMGASANFTMLRVNACDVGYDVLSCKTRSGQRLAYAAFPKKLYYFKFDTDTLIFPGRLQHFLQTLDATHLGEKGPIYFGAVRESGGNLLLCGNLPYTKTSGDVTKGGLCYAQGGAGYGLNNRAMAVMAAAPPCTAELNNRKETRDTTPEDTFTALYMYKAAAINVIHCGGFDSSEVVNERKLRNSITFHYIDSKWLQQHGPTVLKHYHHHNNARGVRSHD